MIDLSKRNISNRNLQIVAEAWVDQEQGINPCYQSTRVVADDDLALDLIYDPLREAWGTTTVQFSHFSKPRSPQYALVESTLTASAGKRYDISDDLASAPLAAKRFGDFSPMSEALPSPGDEPSLDGEDARTSGPSGAAEGRKKKKTAGQLRWEEAVQETQAFSQEVLRGAMHTEADEVSSAVNQARKMVSKDEPPPLIAVRPEAELLRPGAFFKACEANSEALALSIVRYPAFDDVNVIDPKGRTTLMWAAARGFAAVCSELMNRSDLKLTTLNKRDRSALWSALHHAAARGHDKVVILFLESSHFTVANKADGRGRTAFHLAARDGHAAVCRILLTHPGYTKANDLDPRGWSALHYAAMNNRLEVCKVLLYHRDFSVCQVKDIHGHSALDYAEQKGYQKLVSFLSNHPRCHTGERDADEIKAKAVRRYLQNEQAKQEGLKFQPRKTVKQAQVGPKALRMQKMQLRLPEGEELPSQPQWYSRREWSPRLARLGIASSDQEDEGSLAPSMAEGSRLAARADLTFLDDTDESEADSSDESDLKEKRHTLRHDRRETRQSIQALKQGAEDVRQSLIQEDRRPPLEDWRRDDDRRREDERRRDEERKRRDEEREQREQRRGEEDARRKEDDAKDREQREKERKAKEEEMKKKDEELQKRRDEKRRVEEVKKREEDEVRHKDKDKVDVKEKRHTLRHDRRETRKSLAVARQSVIQAPLQEDQKKDPRKDIDQASVDSDLAREVVANEEDRPLGMGFEGLPPGILEVADVKSGTWAHRQQIQTGDLIVAVNDEDLEDMSKERFQEIFAQRPLRLIIDPPDTPEGSEDEQEKGEQDLTQREDAKEKARREREAANQDVLHHESQEKLKVEVKQMQQELRVNRRAEMDEFKQKEEKIIDDERILQRERKQQMKTNQEAKDEEQSLEEEIRLLKWNPRNEGKAAQKDVSGAGMVVGAASTRSIVSCQRAQPEKHSEEDSKEHSEKHSEEHSEEHAEEHSELEEAAGPGVQFILITDKGKEKRVTFTEKPIGLTFWSTLPLKVDKIMEGSQAEKFGIQPGWEIQRVGSVDLKTYEVYDEAFGVIASKLQAL